MSMNQALKLPPQVSAADDHKVHEPSGVRRAPARRRFLQLAAGGAFVGWIGTAASQLSFPNQSSRKARSLRMLRWRN